MQTIRLNLLLLCSESCAEIVAPTAGNWMRKVDSVWNVSLLNTVQSFSHKVIFAKQKRLSESGIDL